MNSLDEKIKKYLDNNGFYPLSENMDKLTGNSILFDLNTDDYFYVVNVSSGNYGNKFITGVCQVKSENDRDYKTHHTCAGVDHLYIQIH